MAWLELSFFDGFVSSYTCTSDRRSLCRIKTFRNFNCIVSCYDTLFSHTTVNRITSIFYCTAKSFTSCSTVFTCATTFKEPSDTDAVTDFETFYIWSQFFDDTDSFVTKDTTRDLTKVTMCNVQVSVADTTVFNFYKSFTCFKRTEFFVLDNFHTSAFWINNNCFHK